MIYKTLKWLYCFLWICGVSSPPFAVYACEYTALVCYYYWHEEYCSLRSGWTRTGDFDTKSWLSPRPVGKLVFNSLKILNRLKKAVNSIVVTLWLFSATGRRIAYLACAIGLFFLCVSLFTVLRYLRTYFDDSLLLERWTSEVAHQFATKSTSGWQIKGLIRSIEYHLLSVI